MMKYSIARFLNLQFISLLLILKNYEETMEKCAGRGAGVIQGFKTYTLAKKIKK